MAQDFYDPLQPFDFMLDFLDDQKATLGLRYIAQNEEDLLPQFPAILLQVGNLDREWHATGLFFVTFRMDLWLFHAKLTVGMAVRSRENIERATAVRKLIHTKRDMDGHIVQGWVSNELHGVSPRVIGGGVEALSSTRLTWEGQNRVPFEAS